MALGRQMIDLIRLEVIDNVGQLTGIGKVSEMQKQGCPRFVRVGVDMVNPSRIERARPPDQSVNLISLGEQELRKIRTILPSDSCNQCLFHLSLTFSFYKLKWFIPDAVKIGS